MRKAANELQTEQDIFSDENLAIWKEYTGVPEAAIKRGAPYAYSRNLALAELEITLEGDGRLDDFTAAFKNATGYDWVERRDKALAPQNRIAPYAP